jgi:hypothetical protein
LSRRRFYLAGFFFHFALIFTVCCRATLSILARGHSDLSHSLDRYWQNAELLTTAALGGTLAMSNPVRQGLTAYLNSAGIEGGYGFFGPHVPNAVKLVFELHFNDGRIEYELPHVRAHAAGPRLSELLDMIRATDYEPLRELMLKMLAYSIWREHPDATSIRAVFGYIDVPSAADFDAGKRESYNLICAYDFRFSPSLDQSKSP